jgi:hypothetical protein
LNPKLLYLLAKSGKTCVAIILNRLKLVSTNFGATLVFKVLSKFTFKNIIGKWSKTLPI